MSQYLQHLKESVTPKNELYHMDFTLSENYTGNETIGELLVKEGFDLEELLDEGVLSMPINKLKGIVSRLAANASSAAGVKKSVNMFKGLASRVSPGEMATKIKKMAAGKDIDEKQIDSTFERIVRTLAVLDFASATLLNPIGWIVILVALMKSGDFDTFTKEAKSAVDELMAGTRQVDGQYEQALAMQGLAIKLLLVCFIPPWIQGVVLMPVVGILSIIAYIQFAIIFLDQFGN